jgi:hypothetical protein
MVWIKRNLSLVISGVIALGLLGYGAWYFWSARNRNIAVEAEIEQTKTEIERLLNMAVTPSPSNLNNARRELERLAQFNARARKQFPPAPPPPVALNDESFKALLQTTVNELHQKAKTVGISIDPDYYFTFSAHRGSLQFRPDTLRPLHDRLHEVKVLASVLLDSRVNNIVAFRRAAVPNERSTGPGQPAAAAATGAGATGDYLTANPRPHTETGMMMWPYEVTFDSFSSQLATVLQALERADQGFIVKAIVTELAPQAAAPRGAPAAQPANQPAQRFQRPGAAPAAAATTAGAAALQTVLDEKLLRVTLHIEMLRPEAPAPGGAAPGGRPGGRP